MDFNISGRKAVVCGASRGMGRSCAEQLANEGVNLVLVARNESALSQTATEIAGKYGVEVETVVADLSVPEGRKQVLAACGEPDILIHNGGWPETDGDFRSNLTRGGAMEACVPDEAQQDIAIRAAEAIGLDFAGVDVLFGQNGPLICEVNSNPHFKTTLECTGVNMAEEIMRHIAGKLERA